MLIQEKYNRWHSRENKRIALRDASQNDLALRASPQDERAKLDRERDYKKKLKAAPKSYQDSFEKIGSAALADCLKILKS